MKKDIMKIRYFPALTLVLGVAGLGLRIWLCRGKDAAGLYPAGHIAGYLLTVLTFLMLAAAYMAGRTVSPQEPYGAVFPGGKISLIAGIPVAICMLYHCFTPGDLPQDTLSRILLIARIAGVIALAIAIRGGVREKAEPFWPYCILTVYLVLYIVAQSRLWGAESQLISHVFQQLATVFLMLTAYQRTALTLGKGDCRWLFVCGQMALFCCCVSLIGQQGLFYGCAAFWLVLEHPHLQEQ